MNRFPFLAVILVTLITPLFCTPVAAQDSEPPVITAPALDPLADAVKDGDLPRVQALLAAFATHSRAADLALSIQARTEYGGCMTGQERPRMSYTRERFVPVFGFLVRHAESAGNIGAGTSESLLFAAAALGDLDTVRYLVEKRGANAGFQNAEFDMSANYIPRLSEISGYSILLAAIHSGVRGDNPDPAPLVRFLLANGANPDAKSIGGGTPLLAAAGIGSLGSVRALVNNGADPNYRIAPDPKRKRYYVGQSALSAAQRNKHKAIADYLAPLTEMTLPEAAAQNNTDRVTHLLDTGANANETTVYTGETALMATAKANAPDTALVLVERGASLTPTNPDGKTALHLAVENDAVATATVLLTHGADPDAPKVSKNVAGKIVPDEYAATQFPLLVAIRRGCVPMVQTLLKHGARLSDETNRRVAQATARTGEDGKPFLPRATVLALLDELQNAGLPVTGNSAITVYAAQFAPTWVLQTLLDRGASPDSRAGGDYRRDGIPALVAAVGRVYTVRDGLFSPDYDESPENIVRNNREEQTAKANFRLLLSRGATVDAHAGTGETAFMGAVACECFDLADTLLKRGANINTANDAGQTALHRAVSDPDNTQSEAVRYLLRRGADTKRRDKNGDTALTLAKRNGFTDAVALLTGR